MVSSQNLFILTSDITHTRFPQGGEAIMSPSINARLIRFLQEDLAVSPSSIAIAQRQREQDPGGPLPIILWQYGLITLEQLDRIYDWLETA